MSKHPDPPVQLRQYLAVGKRQGWPFGRAWNWSVQRLRQPHDYRHRQDWYAVVPAMRWAFELAYRDEDVPGGAAAVKLMEHIADEDDRHEADAVRVMKPLHADRGGRREAA